MHPITRSAVKMAALVAVTSLAISLPVLVALNTHTWFLDGRFYADIGQALAAGKGYQEPHGFFPGRPTIGRLPLWPFLESIPLRLWHRDPMAVVQLTAWVIQGVSVFGVALLTWLISGVRRRMVWAGLIVGLWPGAMTTILAGNVEPCSAAVLSVGTVLICLGDANVLWGAALLSLLPLTRANFVILPFCVAAILLFARYRSPGRELPIRASVNRLMLAAAIYYVPTGIWMTRNYAVSGAFPLLAAEEGQSFSGNYNLPSATPGRYFGRWVGMDLVPGEERQFDLSRRMSEAELDRYYRARGMWFIRQHWKLLPQLVAGRIIWALRPQWFSVPARGYSWYRYWEWIWRTALYCAAILVVRRKRPGLTNAFEVILSATTIITVATVVLFFGAERYLYQLTVLLAAWVCATAFTEPAPPPNAPIHA
jgi:hypothetical protein